MLCAAETGKEVQVVISEMTDFFVDKVSYFSCVEKPGEARDERPGMKLHLIMSLFFLLSAGICVGGRVGETGALQSHKAK